MRQKRMPFGYVRLVLLLVVAAAIIIVTFVLLNVHHRVAAPAKQTVSLSSYCVGQTVKTGDSGHCAADIQTMINYMEHSGLTQCPFEGGKQLPVTNEYDTATAAQVQSIQGWANCYAKQEGFTTNVRQTGSVDRTTWSELCTYGYTNPLRSGANGASDSIAAGKDAGCAPLQQS